MTAAERARGVKGPVSAMRLAEDWTIELADGDLPRPREKELGDGLAVLDERFPEISSWGGSAEEFAQSRGHGRGSRSGRIIHEGRRRPGSAKPARTPKAPKPKPEPKAKSQPAKRSRRDTSRPVRAGAPRRLGFPGPETAWRQTGIPSAVGSGTSLAMTLLGATVGLSLLFLMLRSAESPGAPGRALPELLGTITGFLHRFVSNHDILPQPQFATGKVLRFSAAERARFAAGEVTPKLIGSLPQLNPLPRVRGQHVNPDLGRELGLLPHVLPKRSR